MKRIVLGLGLILAFCFAEGQNINFTLTASHQKIATGGKFKIEFSATEDIDNFRAPSFQNFRVLSGPNQSTSMSWVNGKTSSNVSYSYILTPLKEGVFMIGAATATFKNKRIKSNSIKITVTKGTPVQQNNRKAANAPSTSNKAILNATVNKRKVYQGEAILATYKLYTRINIVGGEQIKAPNFKGFWSKDILEEGNTWRKENFKGYQWNTQEISKKLLYPQRAGKMTLDPMEMKIVSQEASGRGNMFFRQVKNVDYKLKTKAVTIQVMPLPKNPPSGFLGQVGRFSIKTTASKTQVKENEAINIKVKISGKGNIGLLSSPELAFPSDFEVYDPKTIDNITFNSSGASGSKTFDYLIIPRNQGKFTIPPVKLVFFDLATKRYKTVKSKPIHLTILKGDKENENVQFVASNSKEIKILGKDIRYIHTKNINPTKHENKLYNSWWFYLAYILSPLIFISTLVFRNRLRTLELNQNYWKQKKANKLAQKFLSDAQKSLEKEETKMFYENLSKALFGYIANKLSISTSELNRHNIHQQLVSKSISETTLQELGTTLEMCEMARFSPVSISNKEMYSKAEMIINKIEKELKS